MGCTAESARRRVAPPGRAGPGRPREGPTCALELCQAPLAIPGNAGTQVPQPQVKERRRNWPRISFIFNEKKKKKIPGGVPRGVSVPRH